MPGGANGLVLAQQIGARDPDVPVLLTTGYNDEMSIDAPQAHAMDVLGKPYRRSESIGSRRYYVEALGQGRDAEPPISVTRRSDRCAVPSIGWLEAIVAFNHSSAAAGVSGRDIQ